MNQDIDGRFAQGWGGCAPNGVHVNVLLARRGSPTAASITTAFTAPRPGFTPILACVGETQQQYVTVNPPTVILSKSFAEEGGMVETTVFGAAQVGIAQGVLDVVAAAVIAGDQDTLVFVSLWIDPACDDETAVRHASRQAAASAVTEAATGLPAEVRAAQVADRDALTHPFYGGS
ncbi:formaldehyde-activating enzyme [Microbacterium azadirachtae]|uniref:Formaldehyde-activating enzyme n=1 Tax=Microbacterium azadirachtae TaxID=582680 RepID=A0A1I6J373_9MICO|nr:formaldehyde-activating enzyme [Microbacterium azadirachtae]SFR73433.1 formaldehyde-activating enzyme [Microbacterium azadirachtae]